MDATTQSGFGPDIQSTSRGGGFLLFFRLLLVGALLAAFVMGGPVVKTAAVASALMAFFCDRDGALRNLIRLGGFVLAVWIAPRFGSPVGSAPAAHFPKRAAASYGRGV